MSKVYIVLCACIGKVQIVGLCGVLGGQGVDLLHHGSDAQLLAAETYGHETLVDAQLLLEAYGTRNLEVGEALYLGLAQKLGGHIVETIVCMQLLGGVHDVHQLLQEPAVNLGELVNLVDGVAGTHSLGDDEDALVGRLAQCLVNIGNLQLLVVNEAVHALTNHAETLLDNLLEGATDRHHLTYGLHGRTNLAVYATELTEVPTRYLTYNIVDGGLEERGGNLGYRVLQVEEAIAQANLGSHEGQGEACSLGCKGR